MKNYHILLLCILGAALVSSVVCQASLGPEMCCYSFYPRRIKRELIKSYNLTDDRCPRTGVIFMTQRSNRICVDPVHDWVQSIMNDLDKKNI
uniref:C-C motif chemokine n=1 Tax=Anabas testudineus TaxID=64144 RepID=A0AAQ6ITC5_ANATE